MAARTSSPGPDLPRVDPVGGGERLQVSFSVHYRGHRIDVELAEDHLRLSSRPGVPHPIQILVHDQTIQLAPGQEREIRLERRP